MKYFNKQQTNHALCVIFSLFFENLQKFNFRNFYRKQMYSYHFKEFSKIVAAEVRPLLPANLNEVGNKC